MVSVVLPLIALSTALTLVQSAGINFLPHDAAEELRELASSAAWYAANVRGHRHGDASDNDVDMRRRVANFNRKMEGIVSPRVTNMIRNMFRFSGWYASNRRHGLITHFRRDRIRVRNYYNMIVKSGELNAPLVKNIRKMGWRAAWYSANTRAGRHSNARRDISRMRDHFDKIWGTVRLLRARFLNDQLEMSAPSSKAVCQQILPNCGLTETQVECSGSESIGRTKSITRTVRFAHTIGFSITIVVGFGGSELRTGFSAQFTLSRSLSIQESFQRTVTRSYSFVIRAAPHTTNVGTASIIEATGTVPYEFVFDFGGVERNVQGMWNGVLVSDVMFRTQAVPHDPSACLG